jgi:hypothetical protein
MTMWTPWIYEIGEEVDRVCFAAWLPG